MSYAVKTKVEEGQTQSDIRQLLMKFGASSFAFGEESQLGIVMFEYKKKRIRFTIPLSDDGQERRSKWRALLLAIKSKLVTVETGIATFEQEFLAHVIIDGRSVGDILIPQIEDMARTGKYVPLLLGLTSPNDQ